MFLNLKNQNTKYKRKIDMKIRDSRKKKSEVEQQHERQLLTTHLGGSPRVPSFGGGKPPLSEDAIWVVFTKNEKIEVLQISSYDRL